MGYLSSGNPIVDAMGTINITGNIVPTIWYRTVLKENGKPYLLAIAILSDIVYWYRPTEVRDQNTGQITGWRKRFSEDILRQSYQYYADLFGESKKTVKTAIDRLEELQAVKRHFRTVSHGDGLISNNVMYVELIPARVYELTYPGEEPGMDRQTKPCPAGAGDKTGGRLPTKPDTPMENLGGRGIPNGIQYPTDSDTGPAPYVHTLPPNQDTPLSPNGGTNTENTAENTCRDYSIYPSGIDGMDGEQRGYIERIRHNIEYDAYMGDDSRSDRELYEELYELICETVYRKCQTVESTDWNSQENAKKWRKDLADTINAANEQLGIAVHWEHRSFKEQGIDREPTIHIVVRQIKRGHIRQIKSGLIHGNCQKTVGLSSLISSDNKKKKLPMQIKTQAVS